ncbi:ML domain-containing protein [Chaetomium sp. MPI-SDFR-AT-0129]|nr:ML domain-containing protein [Chaetomium sp. MPI-SDFR-AT-0129]
MRLSAFTFALAATASARNVFRPEGSSSTLIKRGDEPDLSVPGDNPLSFCDADREDDFIVIEEVNLSPNPPEAGATLDIIATGTVNERILEGAYVLIEVKYGYIRLVSTKADLCKEIKNVDLECPIEKGKLSITKSVDLPSQIPPGKYTVRADVYSADDDHITCLTASVVFGGKKLLGDMLDL